jgi:hypothetical protein
MQRVSKAWRWPLAGLVLAVVAGGFVPIGGALWVHVLVSLSAIIVLVRIAHHEVPFPVARAQWRLGGDDPAVLRARVLSAAAALQQGRADVAVARLKAVLPDLTRVLGPDFPDTLSTRFLYLQVRGAMGDLPHRITAMEELIGDIEPVLGPGHPDSLAARYCLAEWLNEDGRTEQAEAAYEHVITTGTEQLGADHNVTLIARSSLAILHYDDTRRARSAAVDEMTAVVDGMERALGPDHPTATSTRRLLTQWQNARTDPTST